MKVTQFEDSLEETQIRRLLSCLKKDSKIIPRDMTENIDTNSEGHDNEPKQGNYLLSMTALTAVTDKILGRHLLVSNPPICQQLTPSQVNRRPWKLSHACYSLPRCNFPLGESAHECPYFLHISREQR